MTARLDALLWHRLEVRVEADLPEAADGWPAGGLALLTWPMFVQPRKGGVAIKTAGARTGLVFDSSSAALAHFDALAGRRREIAVESGMDTATGRYHADMAAKYRAIAGALRQRAGRLWPAEQDMTDQARRYRFLGTNDEQSTCSCCGKKELRRVVWLLDLEADGGDAVAHYGTTCAALLLRSGLPGERKPTMAAAARVIEEARQLELERLVAAGLERARELPVPELTSEVIERAHGPVTMARFGDYSTSWDADACGRLVDSQHMLVSAYRGWLAGKAVELAPSSRFDVSALHSTARAMVATAHPAG